MKKNKETLEYLEKQLNSINKVMMAVNSETEILMNNEAVQNYIHYKKHYGKLEMERENLIKEITNLDSELCSHPIFYYLGVDPLEYGTRNIIYVKCLKCGKELSDHPHVFIHNLIKTEIPNGLPGYCNVKQELQILEDNKLDEKEAIFVLKNRYNK